jgi:hypothetical protein
MLTTRQARFALIALRLGVGAGCILAPRRTARLFGIDPGRSAAVPYLVRLFGARDLLMAWELANTEDSDDTPVPRHMAVDSSDLTAALLGALRGDSAPLTLLLGGGGAAANVVLGYLSANDRAKLRPGAAARSGD